MAIHNNKLQKPRYKRIILKLTGEVFCDQESVLSEDAAALAAQEIKDAIEMEVGVAVVLGGGNILRGRSFANARFLEHASSDYMGMVATIINGILLHDVLKGFGVVPRLMSALEIKQVSEPYIQKRAIRHLEKGRVVIQVGGSGRPNFTTDATAVLLAVDIKADAILKGTKVEGIYDRDPIAYQKKAQFFSEISAEEVKKRKLKVIEESALVLNRYNIPIHVFNIFKRGNLKRLLEGEEVGSRIVF